MVSAINDLPSLTYAGSSAASNNDGLSNLPLAGVSADEGATIALDLLVVTDVDADDTYGGVLTLQLDVAAGEVSFNESPYLSLPSFSSSSVSYGAYAFASPLDLNDPGVGPYDTDWTNRYQSFLYKVSSAGHDWHRSRYSLLSVHSLSPSSHSHHSSPHPHIHLLSL